MEMKDRIKKIRKELDLTQQTFADKIGSKRNTVAKYETGDTSPSTAVVSLICKTFNVNENWLRTGEGQMFMETPDDTLGKLKQEYSLDDFSYGLICEYLKLDEKKRDVVRQYFHDVLSHEETDDYDIDIDAEVEGFRQQLLLEKKAREKSLVSSDGSLQDSENIKNVSGGNG